MGGLSRGRLSDETGIPLKTTFGLGVACDDGLLNTWHQGGGLLIEADDPKPVWIGQASSHEATVPGEEVAGVSAKEAQRDRRSRRLRRRTAPGRQRTRELARGHPRLMSQLRQSVDQHRPVGRSRQRGRRGRSRPERSWRSHRPDALTRDRPPESFRRWPCRGRIRGSTRSVRVPRSLPVAPREAGLDDVDRGGQHDAYAEADERSPGVKA